MAENPFYVGGPVPAKYFVGRTSEIRTAFDQISKRSHLALYGSPGMGKSSLLRYVASPEIWKQQQDYPVRQNWCKLVTSCYLRLLSIWM
jgi:replication-associated recombination protein RarA